MTPGRKGLWILAVTCLLPVLSLSVSAKQKPITLKLATVAPEGSTWMKAFHKANRELKSRTGGEVGMRAYPGGVMGDDRTVLRKMRIGQIHIAGLTGLGLSEIDTELQIMGAPFLFRNYEEVDHVLPRIADRLQKALEDRGYVLFGWSEIGFVYLMSNRPMPSLDAIRGAKVWIPEGDPLSQAVLQKAGVSPVPLGLSDVLLALQTGLIDVIYSTPVGALALQWFTKVKYITRVPLSYSLGAVVMTRRALESVPQDYRNTLTEIIRENLSPINAQTRKNNEKALKVMEGEGIRFVDVSPQQLALFQKITHEAMEDIAGKVFSKTIFETVNQHLAEFRRAAPLSSVRDEEKPPPRSGSQMRASRQLAPAEIQQTTGSPTP